METVSIASDTAFGRNEFFDEAGNPGQRRDFNGSACAEKYEGRKILFHLFTCQETDLPPNQRFDNVCRSQPAYRRNASGPASKVKRFTSHRLRPPGLSEGHGHPFASWQHTVTLRALEYTANHLS